MNKKQKELKLKKNNKFLETLIYSKLLMIIILLLIQFALFAIFCLKLEPYTKYFIGGSIALSLLFATYLVNSPGKNEFKISWLIPVLILPVFGISLYFMYKLNFGGFSLNKKLQKIKQNSKNFFLDSPENKKALSIYPKVEDISTYLMKTGNFPPFTNTSTEYFSAGEYMFPQILKDLKSAQKFIFLEYFIIEPSTIWDNVLQILKEKVQNGVEVRLMYDSLGSIAFSTNAYIDYLNSLGIKAQIFKKFVPIFDTGLNNRDHRKILVIDGKIAYTGGINISDEYINLNHKRFDYWKDTGIKIKGPAVRSFTSMFLETWNIQIPQKEKNNFVLEDFSKYIETSFPEVPQSGVVIPYGDDAYNNEDIAENVYNYILSKSHDYVHIMTPYIIIDNSLMNSLIFAAKRGVEVSLIVPSHYDHYITFCVGRKFIKTLIQNGVHVYGFDPGFIHAKVFVSDGNRGTVGSVNLDYRSLDHHFECGLYMYKTNVISDMEKDFQETKKRCTEITMDIYKKYPLHQRVLGWFFKIFAPLL